jgi:hypothetical protein
MAESFLEEQLKRIRQMSERVARARDRAAELTNEIARDREARQHGPLEEVRDFRYESGMPDDDPELAPPRRSTAVDSPRRRRHR